LRQTSLNKQFRGQDLPDLIDSIAAKKLSPERLKKLLGDSEAIDAFQILSQQRDQLRAALADFASNRGRSPIQERLRMAASEPSIAAAARLRETEGRLEVARVPLGVASLQTREQITRERLVVDQSRANVVGQGVMQAALSAVGTAADYMPQQAQRSLGRLREGQISTIVEDSLSRNFGPVLSTMLGLGRGGSQRERPERDNVRDEAALREQRELARQMSAAAEAQRRAAQAIEQAVAPRPRVDRWGPSAQAQHARAAE